MSDQTKAKASGPLWAMADIFTWGIRNSFYDEKSPPYDAPIRILPGHGKWVPVDLVEAIATAFDGSDVHSGQAISGAWLTDVRAAIRAAREGAL